MKSFLLVAALTLIIAGCSPMQKMMIRRMDKMPEEKKMEMMAKMMADGSCMEMMKNMQGSCSGEDNSLAGTALEMFPHCIENIVLIMTDDEKAHFLLQLIDSIIAVGYKTLPESEKEYFRSEWMKAVARLQE